VIGARSIEPLRFRGCQAKEEQILLAYLPGHLDIGAVQGADGQGAVEHEFHVARAAGLFPGGGELLTDFRCGHKQFRVGDGVILQVDDLQHRPGAGVGGDLLGQGVDETDDELCPRVTGRCLGPEEKRHGFHRKTRVLRNAVIQRQDVQGV